MGRRSKWVTFLQVGAVSALVMAMVALGAAPVEAVHNTGKFQLDGNTAGTSALPDDWDNVYRSVTGKGSAHKSSALVQQFLADSGEPDYTTFGIGNRDDQRASQWTCTSVTDPYARTNLLSAFAAAYNVGGNLHLFFGADRETTTGDGHFGFWLFQHPVSCVPPAKGGTGRFSGHKTHGDVFLATEYSADGHIAKIKVYKWTDPDRIPENGDECLGDGVDCSAAHSGPSHPFATGIDCQSSNPHASNPHVCATLNYTGFTSSWRTCQNSGELFEGGLDLTGLFGASGTCFASFMAETRYSADWSSDLKDFVIGELGTCGEITVRKKAVGGDDHFDFDVTAGSLTPDLFTLQGGGAQVWSDVKPGAYAIKELAAPAGWQLTDMKCVTSGGDTVAATSLASGTASITMGLAGTVDCTFTNTRLPRLTVIKKVVNQYGGTLGSADFTLRVDGATVTSGVAYGYAAGTHVVSEGALPPGYVQVGFSGDCDAYGKVTLAGGDSKTCTITNKDVAPRLKVIKRVVNDQGGTKSASDFTMQVTGTGVSTPSFPGSESGTVVTLQAGAYSVDEVAVAGYAKSLSADCAGTIAVGQEKTCTITNDDVPAKLIVIKKVTNTHGGTRTSADFTLTVTGNAPSPASFPGANGAGTTVALKPGAYSVDEVAVTGYAKSLSADCAGSIAAGETKTCTVTNSDVAPRLTVVKHVINNDGGTKTAADFTMQVTGTRVSAPSFAGSEAGTVVTLDAGAYSVDEAAAAGYAKSLSADCAGTIALGESKTCTITNDDLAAKLIVIKKVKNQHGGTKVSADFTITVAGNDPSPSSFPGSAAPGTIVSIKPGGYAVDEVPVAGYKKSLSADCAGTIALGETKTCTVTNKDIAPRLVVIKHVINDNGGIATAANFTMLVTGTAVSTPSFPGAETGTTVTLSAGAYSVDEPVAAGYEKRLGADCSGVIGIGETRTCTITNDDLLPPPFDPGFCDQPSALAVMDPSTGRFPGNRGPDIVVDARTGSIQSAVDGATDVNGDGYIIVGVIASDDRAPGGVVPQNIDVSRAYPQPFAVVACGVVLHDPLQCDGKAAVRIHPTASSPAHPAGSGVTIYLHGISSQNSLSSAGFMVEGDGRFLENVGTAYNMIGIKVVGNGTTLRNATVHDNFSGGIVVQGNGNTIDGARVTETSAGAGIQVAGNGNAVVQSTAGAHGAGNAGHGISVSGSGNAVKNNSAFANQGDGINVSGGSANAPNVVKANVAGAPGAGNIGSGISISGTGNGSGSPVEIASNTTQSNFEHGMKVIGASHQLKNNLSGGVFKNNLLCGFLVAGSNINGTGNKSGTSAAGGADGTPFPAGCQ